MRTVAPLFTAVTTEDEAGDRPKSESEAGESGAGVRGIPIRLPEAMLRLRREPCVIEIYLESRADGRDLRRAGAVRRPPVPCLRGHRRGRPAPRPRRRTSGRGAVLHYFPRPDGPLAFLEESDDDAIWRLITEGLPVMRGLGEVFTTPAFDGLLDAPRPTIRLGLSVRSGLVEISPIADEIDPEDVPGLLASYRRRKRFHRLRNGAFLDMSAVDAGQAEETLSDLDLTLHDLELGPVQVPATSAYYLDAQVDDEAKDEGFRAYVDGLRVVDPQSYAVPAVIGGGAATVPGRGVPLAERGVRQGIRRHPGRRDGAGQNRAAAVAAGGAARRGARGGTEPDRVPRVAGIQLGGRMPAVRAGDCAWPWWPGARRNGVRCSIGSAGRRRRAAPRSGTMRTTTPRSSHKPRPRRSPMRRTTAGRVRPPRCRRMTGPWTEDGALPDLLITSYDLLRRDVEDYQGSSSSA